MVEEIKTAPAEVPEVPVTNVPAETHVESTNEKSVDVKESAKALFVEENSGFFTSKFSNYFLNLCTGLQVSSVSICFSLAAVSVATFSAMSFTGTKMGKTGALAKRLLSFRTPLVLGLAVSGALSYYYFTRSNGKDTKEDDKKASETKDEGKSGSHAEPKEKSCPVKDEDLTTDLIKNIEITENYVILGNSEASCRDSSPKLSPITCDNDSTESKSGEGTPRAVSLYTDSVSSQDADNEEVESSEQAVAKKSSELESRTQTPLSKTKKSVNSESRNSSSAENGIFFDSDMSLESAKAIFEQAFSEIQADEEKELQAVQSLEIPVLSVAAETGENDSTIEDGENKKVVPAKKLEPKKCPKLRTCQDVDCQYFHPTTVCPKERCKEIFDCPHAHLSEMTNSNFRQMKRDNRESETEVKQTVTFDTKNDTHIKEKNKTPKKNNENKKKQKSKQSKNSVET